MTCRPYAHTVLARPWLNSPNRGTAAIATASNRSGDLWPAFAYAHTVLEAL